MHHKIYLSFKLTVDVPLVNVHGPEVHHLIKEGLHFQLTLIHESTS
jgi:hypothetical protein